MNFRARCGRAVIGRLILAGWGLLAIAGCGGGSPANLPMGALSTPAPGPSGGVPIASNPVYTTPPTPQGDTLLITFGNGVPPGETLAYQGVTPPGVFVPATFVTGAVFSVGPLPMPVSAITGVTLVPGTPPQTGLVAAVYQNSPAFLHAAPPFRVAPATSFAPGNDPSPTLLTFISGATYSIAVYRTSP